MEHFLKWVNAERGRVNEVAAAFGITHGAVSQWKKIPAERVTTVSRITGIPRELLRPDLYGAVEAAE